jgi:hypothetical protein
MIVSRIEASGSSFQTSGLAARFDQRLLYMMFIIRLELNLEV